MGLFDKLADRTKQMADSVKKAAEQTARQVGTSTDELAEWAKTMPDKLRAMADDFDADAMWEKLSATAAKAGQELIVMVLTIYYAIESKIPGLKNDKANGK